MSDVLLRKKDWVVRPISLSTARYLVETFHYARSGSNTATYTFGLFRKGEELMDAMCLGCSWWIPPTKSAAQATYPEGDWQKVLSLTRLVITDNVPKNACSFLLARSIKMIDRNAWECLVTYADTWQGHDGTIYKASNWDFVGMTEPSQVFTKNGRMMGRKRGGHTLTIKEMNEEGFKSEGSFRKHKYRLLLR